MFFPPFLYQFPERTSSWHLQEPVAEAGGLARLLQSILLHIAACVFKKDRRVRGLKMESTRRSHVWCDANERLASLSWASSFYSSGDLNLRRANAWSWITLWAHVQHLHYPSCALSLKIKCLVTVLAYDFFRVHSELKILIFFPPLETPSFYCYTVGSGTSKWNKNVESLHYDVQAQIGQFHFHKTGGNGRTQKQK